MNCARWRAGRTPIANPEAPMPNTEHALQQMEPLAGALARLAIEGADVRSGYVIVECEDYYVQFFRRRGDPELLCEAVSNNYLGRPGDRRRRLGTRKIARLHAFGFDDPTAGPDDPDLATGAPMKLRPNFHRMLDASSEGTLFEAAAMTLAIFRDVYGCASDAETTIRLHWTARAS
jgi:hypothetical protein